MKKGQKLNRPRHRSVGLRLEPSIYARVERLAHARRGTITGVLEECLESCLPVLETRYADILKGQDGTSWDMRFPRIPAEALPCGADQCSEPHEDRIVALPELSQPTVVRPRFSISAHAVAVAA